MKKNKSARNFYLKKICTLISFQSHRILVDSWLTRLLNTIGFYVFNIIINLILFTTTSNSPTDRPPVPRGSSSTPTWPQQSASWASPSCVTTAASCFTSHWPITPSSDGRGSAVPLDLYYCFCTVNNYDDENPLSILRNLKIIRHMVLAHIIHSKFFFVAEK